MPFAPRYVAPHPPRLAPSLPAITQAATGGLTHFSDPGGYLPAASLAAALRGQGRRMIWLRLEPQERDPAALLLAVIAASQRACPSAGCVTGEQMHRQPGPLAGWPRLFACLGDELAAALGPDGALVLEDVHHLYDAPAALGLLIAETLAALPAATPCILVGERPPPRHLLPAHCALRRPEALKLSEREALAAAEAAGCGLPQEAVRRAVQLCDGRAAGLGELWAACELLGTAPVGQALRRAVSLDELLARIAHAWGALAGAETCHALSVGVELGYLAPALLDAAGLSADPPAGPWVEPLEDGWLRLRPLWRPALKAALHGRVAQERRTLLRIGAQLAAAGAVEETVELYLRLGARAEAAEVIAAAAAPLMGRGQWATLDDWLSQLPRPTLEGRPTLVYVGGELAAAEGRLDAAGRAFALASRLFRSGDDSWGACQSLLAESTVALWRGDWAFAAARAQEAEGGAAAAGAPWHQSWAAWHLGRLAVETGELDAAIGHFARAAEIAAALHDPLTLELLRQARLLAAEQGELRREGQLQREALAAVEAAERAQAQLLHALLAGPPPQLDAMLELHGWSLLPLMLKLQAPRADCALPAARAGNGLWGQLLGMLRPRQHQPRRSSSAHDQLVATGAALRADLALGHAAVALHTEAPQLREVVLSARHETRRAGEVVLPVRQAAHRLDEAAAAGYSAFPLDRETPARAMADSVNGGQAWGRASEPAQLALEVGAGPSDTSEGPTAVAEAGPQLAVYLLGPFRLELNGRPVGGLQNGRGLAVFKYLLAHSARPTPREILMEAFWPAATPEAARNNLNVALHNARQALRTYTRASPIIYSDGAYSLNPELQFQIDVAAFERHFQAGRRLEREGKTAEAAAAYEAAIELYGGDFLADDPYEEWPVHTRERLRMVFLEALDQLSQIALSQGQHTTCVALCRRILEHDGCREDVCCRLMRCFVRQGQHAQALRQYQECCESLRRELAVEPSPATVELAERIRRREQV